MKRKSGRQPRRPTASGSLSSSVFPSITIIGTSHISKASQMKVQETIFKQKPDCVALELCPLRYCSLLHDKEKKPSIKFGLTHYILAVLQQHLGKKVGVLPGSEMISAVKAAKQVGSDIVLIDMRIEDIMGKMRSISFWEKTKLLSALVFGLVSSPFSKESFDLTKVPEKKLINEAMGFLKKKLPAFYKILVTERNEHMLKNIIKLSQKYKKIIVVVGAGHKKGLERLLKKKISARRTSRGHIKKRKKRKKVPAPPKKKRKKTPRDPKRKK